MLYWVSSKRRFRIAAFFPYENNMSGHRHGEQTYEHGVGWAEGRRGWEVWRE